MLKKIKKAVFKFKPFSKKQLKVLTWWLPGSPVSDKDGIIADGAIRSGKTLSMSLSFVMWGMEVFDQQNFGMCGKTIGSFRRNVLFWLKLMLRSRGYSVKDKRADNLVIVSKGNTTNYFYIFGGKDEGSQDLIQGITLAGVFFDEVALMPESFVNQATGRCSVDGSKFWFNCNPDGPYHWFKVNWVDKAKEKNLIHLHFTMDDNLSLSERVKERYRTMYVGVFFQRYILGLWVMAEGAIYKLFSNNPEDFKIDKPTDKLFHRINIGVDFGGSAAFHTFVATGITPNYKDVMVLMSEKHKADVDPEELNRLFIEFLKKVIKVYRRVDYVYCDSAEQVLIRGFKTAVSREGLDSVIIRNAKKIEIIDRIRLVTALIACKRFFYTEDADTVKRALEEALWDIKNKEKSIRLDDGTTDIDTLDALEYSIEREEKRLIRAMEKVA